jgi:IS5 family transposase
MKAVYNAKNDEQRNVLYADMVKYGEEVLGYAREGVRKLLAFVKASTISFDEEVLAKFMADELEKYADLLERILDQTKRRVFKGESVPSKEKVVSIFEVHSDIIVKNRRETEFGHKVCFTVGKTSMVLDCIMGRGNPSDTGLFPQVIDRQIDLYGESPTSSAADGGFASLDNARYAKNAGIENVYFNKQVGKETEKLFPSAWLRKKLRNFRAGIEGVISALKRAVGLGRCIWRGWESFQSYVWASIVAHNLKTMARVLLKRREDLASCG